MIKNLDFQCAVHAGEIAKEVKEEGTIGKALGVLQEDGVYAFFIYLLSLERKQPYEKKAKAIINQAANLLNEHKLISNQNIDANNVTEIIKPLTENLAKLILAKTLLERTLVYARYHAKALSL